MKSVNLVEEKTSLFWKASLAWNQADIHGANYTYGSIIAELRDTYWHTDKLAGKAFLLMMQIVEDKKSPTIPDSEVVKLSRQDSYMQSQNQDLKLIPMTK